MASDIRQRPEGALLRTYLTAAGIKPESFSKPMIGVVTVATQVFSEKPDARDLGGAVTTGIEAAGGIAVRWDTVRSPELMAWGHAESYSFAWRDQLADLIESWTRQQALDGLVLVGDASETLAGMAMAAARLNVPALMVTAGPKRWELSDEGGKKKASADPFELLTSILFKNKKAVTPPANLESFKDCLLAQDDHEANAFDLVLEALGTCLPGMSTAPSQSPKRHELAAATGNRIVQLVKGAFPFRRVLSGNSFVNAIRLNASLGGSADVAVHLVALAHEAGVNLTLEQFDKIARETPQLCRLGGVGEKEAHRMEDLDRAGGVWAVMGTFKQGVLPTTTISGKGASELARTTLVKDPAVIQARKPYQKQSGIGVMHGNLSPNGAIFLLNQVAPELTKFRGTAMVFENEIEAATALNAGKIKKGAVIVVRGQGPRGGPGLHKMRILPALLESKGLSKTFPVLSDGRFPDRPVGLFIGLLSPESAVRGPLAILKEGDLIEIDTESRQLNTRLTDTEMRVRLARWQAPEPKNKRGFLERYSRSVSEMNEGAVLK